MRCKLGLEEIVSEGPASFGALFSGARQEAEDEGQVDKGIPSGGGGVG